MSEQERETAAELIRSEEELTVRPEPYVHGAVRARKLVDTRRVEDVYEREVEHVGDLERLAVQDGDSGEVETLPDGSVSIPVFEERLVVTKQVVVRERVVIRKRTVTETERVHADLRRERVAIDGDVEEGE